MKTKVFMDITIKPYSKEYAVQCADLEQYLWKEDTEGRRKRLEWAYHLNPNAETLAVIAVNENDEVMGFRPFLTFEYDFNGTKVLIAQLTDTVVSNKARRMGILSKMNDFALNYIESIGIKVILNLSPSWPPYYAYKKIAFEDLAPFHSRYNFSLSSLFFVKLLKNKRDWKGRNEDVVIKNGNRYIITQQLSDDVANQVCNLDRGTKIHSSVSAENMKWRSHRPGNTYVYAYSLSEDGKLTSFLMFKTVGYSNYQLGIYLFNDIKDLKRTWKTFKKYYKPCAVAVWDFATDAEQRKAVSAMRMISIPFINKIRKNPPALLRTLQHDANGELDWVINGIDIRNVNNWSITKFDLDSF